jgi:hypothetical protein
MAERRLVRAPSDAGAALRRLDAEVLREALSQMLREQWDDGSLIYDLVVEGMEPAHVAAERGTSRPALTEQLRDAVARLALEYEHVAYGNSKQEQVCTAAHQGPQALTPGAGDAQPARYVINRAARDGIVTNVAGFVHLWHHALVYFHAAGPQSGGVRGHAVALWPVCHWERWPPHDIQEAHETRTPVPGHCVSDRCPIERLAPVERHVGSADERAGRDA